MELPFWLSAGAGFATSADILLGDVSNVLTEADTGFLVHRRSGVLTDIGLLEVERM